jgi:hypothetical protein
LSPQDLRCRTVDPHRLVFDLATTTWFHQRCFRSKLERLKIGIIEVIAWHVDHTGRSH